MPSIFKRLYTIYGIFTLSLFIKIKFQRTGSTPTLYFCKAPSIYALYFQKALHYIWHIYVVAFYKNKASTYGYMPTFYFCDNNNSYLRIRILSEFSHKGSFADRQKLTNPSIYALYFQKALPYRGHIYVVV